MNKTREQVFSVVEAESKWVYQLRLKYEEMFGPITNAQFNSEVGFLEADGLVSVESVQRNESDRRRSYVRLTVKGHERTEGTDLRKEACMWAVKAATA